MQPEIGSNHQTKKPEKQGTRYFAEHPLPESKNRGCRHFPPGPPPAGSRNRGEKRPLSRKRWTHRGRCRRHGNLRPLFVRLRPPRTFPLDTRQHRGILPPPLWPLRGCSISFRPAPTCNVLLVPFQARNLVRLLSFCHSG